MSKFKLTINNRKIDFHVGLGFLGKYQKDNEITLSEMGNRISENPFYYAPNMMYESAKYSANRKAKDLDFKEDEFLDWLDENCGLIALQKFCTKFVEFLTQDVPNEDEVDDDSSKKK